MVHLGDLGHPLTPRQREAIGRPDVLFLPVGGTYTVGPEAAWAIARERKARVVVPMHYRTGRFGFPQLEDVESFLALCPPEEILRLTDRTWRVSLRETRQIVVFPAKFQEAEK